MLVHKNLTAILGLLIILSFLLTACGQTEPGAPSSSNTETERPSSETGQTGEISETTSVSIGSGKKTQTPAESKPESTAGNSSRSVVSTRSDPVTVSGFENSSNSGKPVTEQSSGINESTGDESAMSSESKNENRGFTDIRLLDNTKKYQGRGEETIILETPDGRFTNPQGCYFDGKTAVQAFIRTKDDGNQSAVLGVYDEEGNLIKSSKELPVDHTNNITFVPEKNAYLVSHCHGAFNAIYYRYSYVDADTFEITETKDLPYPFFSMAYSPEMKIFGSGEWSGDTLDVWDADLKNLKHIDVECPISLSQGIWCDKSGMWFVRSEQNGAPHEIRWYDWDCNLILAIDLTDVGIEPEAISVIDNEVYVISRVGDGAGIFKITFEEG